MPNSFDTNGHSPSNRRLFVIGTCFVAVAAVSVSLAVAKSKGDLDSVVKVEAALVNVGDGLPEKSDVKYQGVLVGQVADVTAAVAAGQPNTVHINLSPEYAGSIPAAVTARVVPSNVFAVSSVQLVDNGNPGSTGLRAGTVIREDQSLPTVLFQTTLNKFRKVFAALSRPSTDRGVGVLETISEATHGRGDSLRRAGGDLNKIVTELNNVVSDGTGPSTLSALADASDALHNVAPDLFDALDSAVKPMRTLAEKQTGLTSFLSAGLKTFGTVADSFDHQTDRLINITTQLTPVVGVLADNDKQFHPISTRLQDVAQRVLSIYDPDTTQFTIKAIVSINPTRTYVRADCPRYGALEGPSCHTAPEVPTAPSLYPALESRGFPPPAGVTENRPNYAPPRGSVAHAGEDPGQGPLPGPPPDAPPDPAPDVSTPATPPAAAPLPAEAGAAQPQSLVIGGNVGPVGSLQEHHQLSQIMGKDANPATQLLLGPVVRGADVELTQPDGEVR
ncbi:MULTISPECIES: MCE family protein [unclassified Mycobacterium]|uniref:MCE family protein n=1 Tax=unclassified Mycobacterium TaxID=2642494 RepID=UPI00049182C6|nr:MULTISPECIES: MCE family protein [unclassified Mycobacterium]SEA60451.1 virulence factor Mce family protein [Mycobacterium sp. 283mftsu]